MKHLLAIRDHSANDLRAILALSEGPARRLLENQGVALYFEKPSVRTRNSMEMAVVQLGGHPVYLQPTEIGIDTRETAEDVTRTLACYHAIVAARVFDHAVLDRMAAVAALPVINLLSATDHPLQCLADLFTIQQLLGRIAGVRVAFIGAANNVARSLAEGCAALGAEFVIASPEGYEFDRPPPGVRQVVDPAEAVEAADIVYSDVWVSMGENDEADALRAAFRHHVVDQPLMERAAGAWFLHCLPARRGEEVSAEVIDGPRSAVWRQAENRMHTARGAMLWMLGDHKRAEGKP